jgi:hypothetical protein
MEPSDRTRAGAVIWLTADGVSLASEVAVVAKPCPARGQRHCADVLSHDKVPETVRLSEETCRAPPTARF